MQLHSLPFAPPQCHYGENYLTHAFRYIPNPLLTTNSAIPKSPKVQLVPTSVKNMDTYQSTQNVVQTQPAAPSV